MREQAMKIRRSPTFYNRRSLGVSLVEIMVAMLIGLILSAALLQLSISHKSSYSFQRAQSTNHENVRYAFYYLEDLIGKAGYIAMPQNTEMGIFPVAAATANCAQFRAGQVIAQSLIGTGVCIRYQRAEATDTDCSGNPIASNAAFVTHIYHDPATNSIMCGAQGAAAITLIDNITNIQFSYGISTTPDLLGKSIDTYLTAPTADLWDDIIAVRVALLSASETYWSNRQETNSAGMGYADRFPLDGPTNPIASDDERRIYYTSQKTITMRNAVL